MQHLNLNVGIMRVLVVTTCVALSSVVLAWTDKVETLSDANTLCKPEPEAQCTQAVRIGLQAPGVDWRNSSLAQMRLDGANLRGGNFTQSILDLSNLKGANLMLANLERAHLHAVNLRDSNLMLANLSGASLLDADLTGANLQGANLQKTILIQAKLSGAIWTDGRICAEGSVGECL